MPNRNQLTSGAWAILPSALEITLQRYTSTPEVAESAVVTSTVDSAAAQALNTVEDGVAVIEVVGAISRWASWWAAGQDEIRAAIDAAVADTQVRAVLLSFYSPGGVVSGVKELSDHIAAQGATKPIYAYADGLCASAAYWLASATGKIYAPLTAEVGSIGVILMHVDYSQANKKIGASVTYIAGGKYKAVGNSNAPLSDADQKYLQGGIDKMHALFRADVSAHMPVDGDNPAAWGDAQVFLASDALQLGLVSEIVTDRADCIAQINKEITMDREELAKKYPDLLASITQEAKNAALAEVNTAAAEASQKAKAQIAEEKDKAAANMLGVVSAVCGVAAAEKVKALLATGITPEQIQAVTAALAPAQQQKEEPRATSGDAAKAAILAALEKATPGAVQSAPAEADDVSATIARIGGLN